MGNSRWITLDGAVNVRDLGGLPTADGGVTLADRLIRSDNLQGLTPADVRRLVDEHHVRAIADLRTELEIKLEGPGPMTREPSVHIENFSLFPEAGTLTDAAAAFDEPDGGPVLLPWQTDEELEKRRQRGAAGIYLGYLNDRCDSVLSALQMIARTDGAIIVHCAAGKDRTGVVVAMALAEVGVERAAIIEDYAMSGDRIEAIFARLRNSPTYAEDLADQSIERHRSRTSTMDKLLESIDEDYGGVRPWLRSHGWTEADAAALRRHLLG